MSKVEDEDHLLNTEKVEWSAQNLQITADLKKTLKQWGNYQAKGKVVLLYDNAYLRDTEFLELCKLHQIRILPDLFTEIPK